MKLKTTRLFCFWILLCALNFCAYAQTIATTTSNTGCKSTNKITISPAEFTGTPQFQLLDAATSNVLMGSMYYLNPYLASPALAGTEKGWELNGAYKAQWTAIEHAPAMQAITATYGSESKKVGFGINLYKEGAGVILRSSAKATYAYHLPLNTEESFLDFGLSAGVMDEWIDFNRVRGDLTDPSLYNFNQRKVYFDGDFGVAFRNKNWTVQ